MTPSEIFFFSSTSLVLIFNLSIPIIGVATGVGLLVAMLQTLVQLQEQTLGFGVKLIAIFATIAVMGSWMASEMLSFFEHIFTRIGRGV